MAKVTELAIYSNYTQIPLNAPVSIISKEFAEFNVSNFSTYSTDDSKFLNGTLISTKYLGGGDGDPRDSNNFAYVVKLDDSREIKFDVNPREYYFKVNPPPRSGGKKSIRKRNGKKSRRNRRKSSRRH